MMKVTCPSCGEPAGLERLLPKYHYKESGLDNVFLLDGVFETKCSSCGETCIRVWKEFQLLQLIARDLLMAPTSRTGPELRYIRNACELTQSALASLLSCRRATVAERELKASPRLSLAEEIGVRMILLKAFQRYLSVPRNCSLDPLQLERLWHFAGDFERFVVSKHRINAAVQQKLWTSDLIESAA